MVRKILFYTNAFDGGGAEVVFARLAQALADAGHDVIFAADHAAAPSAGAPRHLSLSPHHLKAVLELAALLRRERPDASFSALGAHNLKHVLACVLAGRLRHGVLGVHGFAAAEPRLLSQLSFWTTPILTRLAARTICVSDALRDNLIRQWHASPRRVVRIYNPVAAPKVVSTPSSRDDPPLVLAVGRMMPIKRFGDLVAAFAGVVPSTARLAILGDGPERPMIEAAGRALGLGDRISLPGHVDPAPWYRRASCLVVASESESFGLTIAEALAEGVPVVSTDCGGPREILGGGHYGRLVPVGDQAALADAITRTLTAPGDPAPRIARADAFRLATIRDAYLAIVDDLAAPRINSTKSMEQRR